jgi:NADH-quinone oxidoreductase subunit M
MGLLSLLLWTPALGSALLVVIPAHNIRLLRGLSCVVALIAVAFSAWLAMDFNRHSGSLQFNEHLPLNPHLGSSYTLGLDGFSLPMVLLTSTLLLVALIASWHLTIATKSYYLGFLVTEFGMLGVFLSQNWTLFYIFWEITVIPLYFLIGRWGGPRRQAASLNFALYALIGSACMLVSLLALSQYDLHSPEAFITTLPEAIHSLPITAQILVLLGFLVGFGIFIPLFPLHGWLTTAHIEAPSSVSMLLSGLLVNMGAYGLLRIFPSLPDATFALQPYLLSLGALSILYPSLLAWRQHTMNATLTYASFSQMGMVLLSMSTLTEAGWSGAIFTMMAQGLIYPSLFLLTGGLFERTQTFNINHYGALLSPMPRFSLLLILSLFAASGLPGGVAFIATIYVFISCFETWPWLVLVLGISVIIKANYLLSIISALLSVSTKAPRPHLVDLRSNELIASGLLVSFILGLGCLPSFWLTLSTASIKLTQTHFSKHSQPIIHLP